jgi:hypothetical protein
VDHVYLWIPWLVVAAIVGTLLRRHRHDLRPRAIAVEVLIVVSSYALYYVVRGVTAGNESSAVRSAQRIIDLQQFLGLYWEPTVQEFVLDHRWLTLFFNWVYVWWHWPVVIVVAVWLFLEVPPAYRLYRDAFLISGAVALVFFALMPVAPPRLSDPNIVDTISQYSTVYRTYETPRFVNQYAAFPSLHFAWNLLASIAVFAHAQNTLLRVGAVASPVLLTLAIVVTGNHFFIDAAAGCILAVAALVVARSVQNVRWRRRVSHWLQGG